MKPGFPILSAIKFLTCSAEKGSELLLNFIVVSLIYLFFFFIEEQ